MEEAEYPPLVCQKRFAARRGNSETVAFNSREIINYRFAVETCTDIVDIRMHGYRDRMLAVDDLRRLLCAWEFGDKNPLDGDVSMANC